MAGLEARATTGILYPIIHNLAQFVKQNNWCWRNLSTRACITTTVCDIIMAEKRTGETHHL